MRDWLPRFSVERPVTVSMLFIALCVLGIISFNRISLQMMPSGFDPGMLWIWIPYSNSNPTEVDEQIIRPIEAQFTTVGGMESIHSNARVGSGSFRLVFSGGVDLDEAYNDVVDRLERAMPDLPDDVQNYGVYRYNPSDDPIVWVGVELPEEIEDPYHVMQQIVVPELQRISGVANVEYWGVPRQAVYIDWDKERVYAHSIDLGKATQALSSDNFQQSAGKLTDRGQTVHVRSLSQFKSVDDYKQFPIKDDIVLGDVAEVRLRSSLSSDISRVNGKEAASMSIKKESSANTVGVGADVIKALEKMNKDPRFQGAKFFPYFNQAELIQDSIGNLWNTALTGGLFAVLILYLFLREWRMTLLISASIPFSTGIAVILLYAMGESLNLLSLMGLMLAVGMVVDNAIVVVETIYRRRAQGESGSQSAIGGASEVSLAIFLSTLTTMVVFLPVILMSADANFGRVMASLGLPVVFALGGSLLVALIFAPLAASRMTATSIRPDPKWLTWFSSKYRGVLGWVTNHRMDSIVALMAMLMMTKVIAVEGVQCTSESERNVNNFWVTYSVPPQASIYERDDLVRTFEAIFEDHREEWGIRVYRAMLWGGNSKGEVQIFLEKDGPMEREDVMKAVEKALPTDIPGVVGKIGWGQNGGGGAQINLRVFGENLTILGELTDEIARRVGSLPNVIKATPDIEANGADEIHLEVDTEAAARYGVDATQIGQLVSYAMRGSTLPSMKTEEREVAVRAAFSLEDRSRLEKLLDLDVYSPTTQQLVAVRALTNPVFTKGPGQIRRENKVTSAKVVVDLKEGTNDRDAMAAAEFALSDMTFPRGYGWSGGQFDADNEREDSSMLAALILSISFVFLILGVLFESWVLPLSILTTIPMALAGAFWALYLWGSDFDSMAGVGLIILIGVVVNNGIVLVDRITQLRASGLDRHLALLQAGEQRLRPILMTAATTIFGLLPMAFGGSTFIGIPYAPLGRTVIGGLAAGTVLTLLFVPLLYTLLDDARESATRWLSSHLQ